MARFLTKDEELFYGQQIQDMISAQQKMSTMTADGTEIPDSQREELNEIIETGRNAVDTMVRANLRLVHKRARSFKNSFVSAPEYEDVAQDGMVGLMNAILKYDPSRNNKLSTVATYWIFQSISRQANKTARMVRLPENRITEFLTIKRMRAELEDEGLSTSEADDIIMDELGLSKSDFMSIVNAAATHVSLNLTAGSEDNGRELMDTIVDGEAESVEDTTVSSVHHEILSEALTTLDDKERDIVSTAFSMDLPDGEEPLSPKDVKKKYRINVAEYDRIVGGAMRKIKVYFESKGISDIAM